MLRMCMCLLRRGSVGLCKSVATLPGECVPLCPLNPSPLSYENVQKIGGYVALRYTAALQWASGLWNFCRRLPHCRGQWIVEPVRHTATLQRAVGSGQWNSCGTLPPCRGQWAVEILQYTATLSPRWRAAQQAGPTGADAEGTDGGHGTDVATLSPQDRAAFVGVPALMAVGPRRLGARPHMAVSIHSKQSVVGRPRQPESMSPISRAM